MVRAIALLLSVLLSCVATVAFADTARVALVIGNASYRFAPLKNPTNDAKAMAQALRVQGFEVIERENATKAEMEKAIVEFGRKLKADGTGIVYYSGHGIQVAGKNYLIPLDAVLTDQREVPLLAVDADNILIQMQEVRSKVNIVILDACRDNPFEQSFRSLSGGLAQMSAPSGTLIAYATAPGKTASDGSGDNGLYTQELLKAMSEPGLKVEEVFKKVRLAVSRASGDAQIPWESSSLTGDFYFQPPAGAATETGTPSVELAFWETIQSSSNPADFQAYLKKYPNGDFADLAHNRMAALQPAAQPAQTQIAVVPPSKTIAPDPSDDLMAKADAPGAAQDPARVFEMVRKGAERGNPAAQTRLGWLYQSGKGVGQDYGQALIWYRKAADQGFARAEAQLGWLYQNGWGVAQDYRQALIWYHKAADQNDAAAQMRLGMAYLKGDGVAANKAEARQWLNLAAKQGLEAAKKVLAKLDG